MTKLLMALIASSTLTACAVTPHTASSNPQAAPAPVMRNVAVISNEPMNLALCDRACNTVAKFAPNWEQTGRGYEATIKISTAYFTDTSFLKLIREDQRGWSDWGPDELKYLRSNDVTAKDPACLGGHDWCAVRGL